MGSFYKSILGLTLACFIACNSGDSDSDSNNPDLTPDNNACDVIGLNNKIVNGTSCANPESSAIVRIALRFSDGLAGVCTGTMITPNKLITAAHCFEDAKNAAILIGDDPKNLTVINATVAYIHPDYSNPNNNNNRNDIAILELERAANLPTMPILIGRDLDKNEIVSVFGYGQSNSGALGTNLRSGEMKVSKVNSNFVEALYEGEGSNVCFGDSGGPLLAFHNGAIALFATTSFGTRTDCKPGDRTSFVKLQSPEALEFINNNASGVVFK